MSDAESEVIHCDITTVISLIIVMLDFHLKIVDV